MLTVIQHVIASQYGAALRMLRAAIERADDPTWHAPVGRIPFWHVAYHALFYTDLYLSPGERSFRPPDCHVEGANFFGRQPWPPFKEVTAPPPYEKATLLEYQSACAAKAKAVVAGESEATLAGPSGFDWLRFTRLELHFYNIRHIQHHTGQLGAALLRQTGEGIPWIGSDAI